MQEAQPSTEKPTMDASNLKENQFPTDARENKKQARIISLTTKQTILLLCTMLALTVAGLIVGFASGIHYGKVQHDSVSQTAIVDDNPAITVAPTRMIVDSNSSNQGPNMPPSTWTPTVEPSLEPTLTPTPTPLPSFFEGPIEYGRSVNNLPLYAYRLGYGESARVIIGGIHGGYEWNTVELVSNTLKYFQEHTEEIPTDITLYLIPNMNPDGYAADTSAEVGRMNGNLVDLNRNWDYQWQITATHGTRPVKTGTGSFSEPETAATRDFILNHNIELAIFYHSAMGVIFSGTEREKCATFELAEMLSQATRYPHQTEGIYGQISTGDAIDYLSTVGIAAAEIELTTHNKIDEQEWQRNLAGIQAFLSWIIPDVQHALPEEALTEGNWKYEIYTIREGDTLWGIAESYGIDINSSRYEKLLHANNITETVTIKAGETLKIPKGINTP